MGGGDWPHEQPSLRDTGGVKPIKIGGRLVYERERQAGMTPEEREWRRKFLNDLKASKGPRLVPQLKAEMLNPIRRFYRWPLDFIWLKLASPYIGMGNAEFFRFYTGRILLFTWGAFAIHYYFKYNTNSWEARGRWRIIQSHSAVYPGEPGYPFVAPDRAPHQYHDRGFSSSIFAKNYAQYINQAECEDKKKQD